MYKERRYTHVYAHDTVVQAHGLGFQNLKPEPQALSSHALGLGLAGLSRAGTSLLTGLKMLAS